MKAVLLLTLGYLRFNKIKTAIMVFSVAVAVFLPLAVNLLVRDYQRNMLARAKATPLVAGRRAAGSTWSCTPSISAANRARPDDERPGRDPRAAAWRWGCPCCNKYAARGQPIVGTSLEYFDFRGLRIAAAPD